MSTETARSSLLESAHLSRFPTAIDERPAADRVSSAEMPRVSPVVRLLRRIHRGARHLRSDEEALMPMWISSAYALILVVGLPIATVSWLKGFTPGLATSLAAMFILGLSVFWFSMRKVSSLEPMRTPPE